MLPLRILERQYRAFIANLDAFMRNLKAVKALYPPVKCLAAIDTERDGSNRARALAVGTSRGPVKECQVEARFASFISVEKVIGANIILIDGLFDETHA